MPRLTIKLKKKIWGGLGWVEGELTIEAFTVEQLLEIAKKRPELEVK